MGLGEEEEEGDSERKGAIRRRRRERERFNEVNPSVGELNWCTRVVV